MKMWEGRFKKSLADGVNDFNSSIKFDFRLYREDITGSIAHAKMLGKTGIVKKEDSEAIIKELKSILDDISEGTLEIDHEAEDIHMFVEAELTKRIGDTGKKLHTARSRNDQVALDIRMYLYTECKSFIDFYKSLINKILYVARLHKNTLMPGCTHLQHGQPVSFAHHILAYAQMIKRDMERMCDVRERIDYMPLGACALAGTTYPIDRHFVAGELGFSNVTENSIDSVSDRDFIIEFLSALSVFMMHLSRFSEEIILWCSSEYSFIELDDAYSTGSSIMPQKKNPDIAELVRGKTGRVYGSLMSVLSMMKSLPLAYNKDMQEDKEVLFDAIDNAKLSGEMFLKMFATMKVKTENMANAAKKGFLNATDCADYLVKKELPFREAYKITGNIIAYCIEKDYVLETLPIMDYKRFSPLFGDDIYEKIDLLYCLNERKSYGGPSVSSVEKQIDNLKKFIDNTTIGENE